jgi:hypothetical protein
MKMSDAYLFVSYKQAADPSRLAAYGALAVRVIEHFGGTVIARHVAFVMQGRRAGCRSQRTFEFFHTLLRRHDERIRAPASSYAIAGLAMRSHDVLTTVQLGRTPL